MDFSTMKHLCKCQYTVFGIPIRIMKKWTLIEKFDSEDAGQIADELGTKELENVEFNFINNIAFYVSPNFLAYGIIKNEDTDYVLVLGPCRSTYITENTIKDLIIKNNFSLDKSRELLTYINNIPMMNLRRFAYTLSYINTSLNQSVIQPSEFCDTELEYKEDSKIYKNVLLHNEKVVFGEIQKNNAYDFLKRMSFFIQNGMTSKIKNIWNESIYSHDLRNSPGALRHAKNSGISLISFFGWAAMQGGLDADTALALQEMYIDQIESCDSGSKVMELRYNIIIDFCERVRARKIPLTDDPSINRIMNYILQNVDKKITVEELSALNKMNSAYLSVKFKKLTGTSLTDYINIQKVAEAKYLLRFTEKPLVVISNYLMFSSQSYFHRIFKEHAGVTPKEYRNSKDELKDCFNKTT